MNRTIDGFIKEKFKDIPTGYQVWSIKNWSGETWKVGHLLPDIIAAEKLREVYKKDYPREDFEIREVYA